MIPRKSSEMISLILTLVFLALCVIALFVLPPVLKRMMVFFEKDLASGYLPTLICAYAAFVPAIAALGTVAVFMRRVMQGEIFCSGNTACLRIVSWCCFAELIPFGVLSFYYFVAPFVAVCFVFLGVIVRVIKNAFARAEEIKEENDMVI